MVKCLDPHRQVLMQMYSIHETFKYKKILKIVKTFLSKKY
jgi:hypothetical protein